MQVEKIKRARQEGKRAYICFSDGKLVINGKVIPQSSSRGNMHQYKRIGKLPTPQISAEMCNVECNFKCSLLIKKQYDILCETWLKEDQTVSLPRYSWFGQNRLRISQRAIRRSGGVGILVKSNLLQDYNASILDSQMEGILYD